MTFELSSREPIVDLSNYFIMKKLSDGWLVGPIDGGEPRFIFRNQLIEMGYLDGSDTNQSDLPPTPTAIVVPTVTDKRRSVPLINPSRADLDDNWRKK